MVDYIWYSEGFHGTHEPERLLPNGESGIIFDLHENPICIYDSQDTRKFDTVAAAIFCRERIDSFVVETCRQERVIGVQFRPGGAYPFLDMPASRVANTSYSLDDAWPREAALIHEQLMFAREIGEMFAILERALHRRLGKNSALHPAVTYAIERLGRSAGRARVRDVAEQSGLSSRKSA